jgi:hypothetical protein
MSNFGCPIKILHKFLFSPIHDTCLAHLIFLDLIKTTGAAAATTTKTTSCKGF